MSRSRGKLLNYYVKRFTHIEAQLMSITVTQHVKLINDEDRNTPSLMDTCLRQGGEDNSEMRKKKRFRSDML